MNFDSAAACHTLLFPQADQSDDCFPFAPHNGLVTCPEETIKRLSCFKTEGFAAAAAAVMMSVQSFFFLFGLCFGDGSRFEASQLPSSLE